MRCFFIILFTLDTTNFDWLFQNLLIITIATLTYTWSNSKDLKKHSDCDNDVWDNLKKIIINIESSLLLYININYGASCIYGVNLTLTVVDFNQGEI